MYKLIKYEYMYIRSLHMNIINKYQLIRTIIQVHHMFKFTNYQQTVIARSFYNNLNPNKQFILFYFILFCWTLNIFSIYLESYKALWNIFIYHKISRIMVDLQIHFCRICMPNNQLHFEHPFFLFLIFVSYMSNRKRAIHLRTCV